MKRDTTTKSLSRSSRIFASLAVWLFAAVSGVAAVTDSAKGSVNPPKVSCASASEALQNAMKYAASINGTVVQTSGTPSMKPLINGRVFAVIKKHAYDSIEKSQLLVYMGRPDARRQDRQSMLHRAVLRDRGGWLMSGDNNARSESWDRVTPNTYVGTVEALFEVAS